MKINSLQDLYIEELQDLYSAENQLVKALPKVIEECTSDELRSAIEDHLDQTREQIERLDQIFEGLEESAKGKKCAAMEGLVKECQETLSEDMPDEVKDAAIIAACQRVEHYEIAGYGTVCTFAKLLGREDDLDLLGQTLDEEKEADETLTDIAENTINIEAAEEEEEEEESPAAKKKSK
jgi:ferritin-like metal-binding protein YciE